MLLSPGQLAIVPFEVSASGEPVALALPIATVFRGSVATSLVPTIANPTAGLYLASFGIPTGWADYDLVMCRLAGSVSGKPISRTKVAGVVLRLSAAGLTQEMSDRIGELYRFRGLDPANPWSITDTSETAGNTTLGRTDNGTTTTVSRQP